jgi:hypothetical protein
MGNISITKSDRYGCFREYFIRLVGVILRPYFNVYKRSNTRLSDCYQLYTTPRNTVVILFLLNVNLQLFKTTNCIKTIVDIIVFTIKVDSFFSDIMTDSTGFISNFESGLGDCYVYKEYRLKVLERFLNRSHSTDANS